MTCPINLSMVVQKQQFLCVADHGFAVLTNWNFSSPTAMPRRLNINAVPPTISLGHSVIWQIYQIHIVFRSIKSSIF